MGNFKTIYIHCSQSEFGHTLMIDRWHKNRKPPFRMIGYGLVILNGYPIADWWNKKIKVSYLEGSVEIGRPIDSDKEFESFEQQAGVFGMNKNTYHICMIGNKNFSDKVLNATLKVVRYHLKQFELESSAETVKGHYESDSNKTCPNINMDIFRNHLKDGTNYGVTAPVKEIPVKKELTLKKIISKLFKSFFYR